jgi:hypothetical protein
VDAKMLKAELTGHFGNVLRSFKLAFSDECKGWSGPEKLLLCANIFTYFLYFPIIMPPFLLRVRAKHERRRK